MRQQLSVQVRRFNYFDFNQRSLDSLYLGRSDPRHAGAGQDGEESEVTIRMRGVMEKCTYCVQRIGKRKDPPQGEDGPAGNPSDIVVPDGCDQDRLPAGVPG